MESNVGTPCRRHVLIVDDDIQLAWSLKQALEQHAIDATIVPDGALALKFILNHSLDAVVCDLAASRLEGDLLYATVERANPSLARRFIFITAAAKDTRMRKFAESVALPVVHKPVAVEDLAGKLATLALRDGKASAPENVPPTAPTESRSLDAANPDSILKDSKLHDSR